MTDQPLGSDELATVEAVVDVWLARTLHENPVLAAVERDPDVGALERRWFVRIEGEEKEVDETLADLDVASGDGGSVRRVGGEARSEEAVLGENDADGVEEPFVEGNVTLGKQAKNIDDCTADDGGGGVEVGGVTRGRTSEVEGGLAISDGDDDDEG